jgi:hypothetical protein
MAASLNSSWIFEAGHKEQAELIRRKQAPRTSVMTQIQASHIQQRNGGNRNSQNRRLRQMCWPSWGRKGSGVTAKHSRILRYSAGVRNTFLSCLPAIPGRRHAYTIVLLTFLR